MSPTRKKIIAEKTFLCQPGGWQLVVMFPSICGRFHVRGPAVDGGPWRTKAEALKRRRIVVDNGRTAWLRKLEDWEKPID